MKFCVFVNEILGCEEIQIVLLKSKLNLNS